MTRGSLLGGSILSLVITQMASQTTVGPHVLAIDAANSRVVIQVDKAGLLGFAGHAHEVAATSVGGRVTFDFGDLQRANVTIELPTAALRVTGKGEPPADVPTVQNVMMSERVLDASRYPTITFSSRRVMVTSLTGSTAELVVEGDLKLRARTRPVTVHASVALDPGGRLTARGAFALKQSDFGMLPVTAAGGTIRVKDELEIQFVLKTRPSDDPRTVR